jgi:hypothetical protein
MLFWTVFASGNPAAGSSTSSSGLVLFACLFNCAQIAEKAITIILLPHKTNIITKASERKERRERESRNLASGGSQQ